LRFVISVAKKYQNQGIAMGDLINEGNLGLITAAKRFDETKGFRFISYAVWWIRQSITGAISAQSRLIHLPYNYTSLMGRYNKSFNKLEQEYNRRPTLNEVADDMQIELKKIHDMLNFYSHEVSLHRPINQNTESTLLDIMPDHQYNADQSLIKESLNHIIQNTLQILSARDREIIQMYFGLNQSCPLPLENIADKFNLSIEHTRRLKDIALQSIRNSDQALLLKSCLD